MFSCSQTLSIRNSVYRRRRQPITRIIVINTDRLNVSSIRFCVRTICLSSNAKKEMASALHSTLQNVLGLSQIWTEFIVNCIHRPQNENEIGFLCCLRALLAYLNSAIYVTLICNVRIMTTLVRLCNGTQ